MAWPPIEPASLDWQADGTPLSTRYGDIYHSSDGGPGQARHVFLAGNDLPQRWAQRDCFVILETGFGTGLNFLATWATWRDSPQRPRRLHYLAVEKHPFSANDLARLHARWPEFADLSTQLCAVWPLPLAGFHRLQFLFGDDTIILTLLFGEARDCLQQLVAQVDAFYLDGFDPKKNPAMWSPELMQALASLAAPGATLATWCVASAVRVALTEAGFQIDKQPGFGRKRHRLVGRLAGQVAGEPVCPPRQNSKAIIIGAGLAGCSIAERLAQRGWQVELIERHAQPSAEGSGNLAGIIRPLLSRDDNAVSRLNRACFLYTYRTWQKRLQTEIPIQQHLNGVAQIARDSEQEVRLRQMAEQWPAAYVSYIEHEALSQKLGHPVSHGGLWFALGGWAQPPDIARTLLASGGTPICQHFGVEVASLVRVGNDWQALDAQGALIATAPVLIVASGATPLPLTADLPIEAVRGQVNHIPAGQIPALNHALCSEGYLTPSVDGLHCLGATYAHDPDTELRESETRENLQRLARMLPTAKVTLDASQLGGRVGFRATTSDRMPLIGRLPVPGLEPDPNRKLTEIPRLPEAYALLGLGSRGLVWAALAAETLACQIESEPLPLEADLIACADPARFLMRGRKRGL